jgi:hypothetical protein
MGNVDSTPYARQKEVKPMDNLNVDYTPIVHGVLVYANYVSSCVPQLPYLGCCIVLCLCVPPTYWC